MISWSSPSCTQTRTVSHPTIPPGCPTWLACWIAWWTQLATVWQQAQHWPPWPCHLVGRGQEAGQCSLSAGWSCPAQSPCWRLTSWTFAAWWTERRPGVEDSGAIYVTAWGTHTFALSLAGACYLRQTWIRGFTAISLELHLLSALLQDSLLSRWQIT